MSRKSPARAVWWAAIAAAAVHSAFALADSAREAVVEEVVRQRADAEALASDIWGFAELGYLEERSAARLADYLSAQGFGVEMGVAGIPTAFVATRGRGAPTLAVLAEFDALPGLSQAAQPTRAPVLADAPGHACGHHLFGAASVTAAVAIARWLEAEGIPGTVKLYGTPAEEGGSGKVYLTARGSLRRRGRRTPLASFGPQRRIPRQQHGEQVGALPVSRCRGACGNGPGQGPLRPRRGGSHELHGQSHA